MAEHIGEVKCLECGGVAAVFADKRQWVYTNCSEKLGLGGNDCGINKYQAAKGQARIKARWLKEQPEKAAQFLGVEDPAPVEETPAIPQTPEPPKPAPDAALPKKQDPPESRDSRPKKPGFFGTRPLYRANKQKGAV